MRAQSASPLDPDAALMLAVRDGDQAAFRELFQRHAARLVGYADRFFHNRARSEELVQEVFLKVWRARKRYEPRSKFTTWLYTIASRTCLNELRRRGRRQPEEVLDEGRRLQTGIEPQTPEALLEGARMQSVIERCLDGMPDNQRHALVLTRFGGHSYQEVAKLLSLSESAVKSLIFRAATAIRQAVEAHEQRAEADRIGLEGAGQ